MDLNIFYKSDFLGINTSQELINFAILPFCHFVHHEFFFQRHFFGNLFWFFSYPHYLTILEPKIFYYALKKRNKILI
jgi:hypothetical protein